MAAFSPRSGVPGSAYSLSRLSGAILPFITVSVLDGLGATAVFIGSAAILAVLALDAGLLGPRSTGLNLEESSDEAAAPAGGRFSRTADPRAARERTGG